MKLLVSNVGSTSLKFKLYDMPSERVLCEARIERVGGDDAIYTYKNRLTGHEERALVLPANEELGIARRTYELITGRAD